MTERMMNIRATAAAVQNLKRIGAETGETMGEIVARLAEQELASVRKKMKSQ